MLLEKTAIHQAQILQAILLESASLTTKLYLSYVREGGVLKIVGFVAMMVLYQGNMVSTNQRPNRLITGF